MMLRLAFMFAWLGFVAACSEQIGEPPEVESPPAAETVTEVPVQPATPQPAPLPDRVSVTTASAEIDWAAARADLASAGPTEAGEGFQIQSGDQAPPVPVLIVPSSARPASAGGETPRFRELADGYFAHYPGDDYNVTISGTNEVIASGTMPVEGASAEPRFQSTATGAIVSLSRYGAGYMVEFECNGLDGAAGDACIDEEEALSVANQLIIAGTR